MIILLISIFILFLSYYLIAFASWYTEYSIYKQHTGYLLGITGIIDKKYLTRIVTVIANHSGSSYPTIRDNLLNDTDTFMFRYKNKEEFYYCVELKDLLEKYGAECSWIKG